MGVNTQPQPKDLSLGQRSCPQKKYFERLSKHDRRPVSDPRRNAAPANRYERLITFKTNNFRRVSFAEARATTQQSQTASASLDMKETTVTQTQPDRLDQLESIIERIDRKLDAIASDIVEIKISQAKTDERFKGIDQRFNGIDSQLADIKIQIRAQDARLWTFITALILAVVGLLAKFLFFPQA